MNYSRQEGGGRRRGGQQRIYLYICIQYIIVATTIRISKKLLQELENLKRDKDAKSYEEVIKELIEESKRLKKSHFGSLPELEKFEREEIDRFD